MTHVPGIAVRAINVEVVVPGIRDRVSARVRKRAAALVIRTHCIKAGGQSRRMLVSKGKRDDAGTLHAADLSGSLVVPDAQMPGVLRLAAAASPCGPAAPQGNG